MDHEAPARLKGPRGLLFNQRPILGRNNLAYVM
jgi:hypothetical protein